jgi:hypothetical protein
MHSRVPEFAVRVLLRRGFIICTNVASLYLSKIKFHSTFVLPLSLVVEFASLHLSTVVLPGHGFAATITITKQCMFRSFVRVADRSSQIR